MAEIFCLLKDSSDLEERLRAAVGDAVEDQVEIVLTDPGHMKVLNSMYRHINLPTDVITFDLSDAPDQRPAGTIFVDGRLYPPLEELLERVFHGYLHLMGYTHDTPDESREMNEKVSEMVLGIIEDRKQAQC